jgi:CYTH domain-containing protein
MDCSKNDKPMSPFQERVLRMYQSYRKSKARYRVANRNARLTIRKEFMDWLALASQREAFALEVMPVSEQAEMIDAIVQHLQDKRTAKSKESHTANKKRAAEVADKQRQQSFDL